MKPAQKQKILIFGGSGSIGQAVTDRFIQDNWDVYVVTRKDLGMDHQIIWDPTIEDGENSQLPMLRSLNGIDAVCWAQGMNLNDDIYSFDIHDHNEMYRVNVMYILNSLKVLLSYGLLNKPAKLCIVSSIWQNISRQNKLSYSVTKAALQGLVLSACNDLGRDGHLINAVLPGALESPMTRANLSSEQLLSIENATQFSRLAGLGDVANTVFSLCSDHNTGVTGNFITVDLGFSYVRNI